MELTELKQELLLSNIIFNDDKIQFKVEAKLKKLPELRQLIIDTTHFLEYDASLKTRIYCVLRNIAKQPKCEVCDKVLKMRMNGVYRFTFPRTCGSKCSSTLKDVKAKRKKTNLQKYGNTNVLQSEKIKEQSKIKNLENYGVENVLSSPLVREQIKRINLKNHGVENLGSLPEAIQKRKDTNRERYGFENAVQNKDIRDKMKQTNIELYGVENVWLYDKFQEKRFDTMQEKYGVDYPLQSPEIRQNFTDTMQEKYGVDYPLQSPEIRQSFTDTMQEKHGVDHPLQSPEIRQTFTDTMQEKYGVDHPTQQHLTPEALLKSKDREWLIKEHHDNKRSISDIANTLGYSQTGLCIIFHKLDIEVKYYFQSTGEIELYELIKSIIPDEEIIQSDRSVLGAKELDIYIPSKKLAFEYNGIFWHSDLAGKNKSYHLEKTNLCKKKGIRLVQIWDNEWISQRSIVISRINTFLGMSTTIYARKCKIVEPSKEEVKQFLKSNHIQGSAGYSTAYGLEYNGQLVSVLSMGKSRFSKQYDYELIRYANVLNCSIVGGASKLFKHFVKEHNPYSIITYSDRRWNTGNLYMQLGFEFKHTAAANYFYFHETNSDVLMSRQNFQKHKLSKKLEFFDPLLTEWENMKNNGYNRIWDCGNDVFVWSI